MQLAYREKVIQGAVGYNQPDKPHAPNYKVLKDYSHLITAAKDVRRFVANGDTRRTVKLIFEHISKFYPQVSKLAAHLKAKDLEQTAFNNWHFVKTYLAYAPDTPGLEEVRSPARAWKDRFEGVDCDCMTVFIACLLINQGYFPMLEVVELQRNGYYQHIFLSVSNSPFSITGERFAIDTVPEITGFNRRSPGITTTLMIPIYSLEGLSGLGCSVASKPNGAICGIGCAHRPTRITQYLIQEQRRISHKAKRHWHPCHGRQLRKLHYLILLNDTVQQAIALGVLPHIADISNDGIYMLRKHVNPSHVANYFSETDAIQRNAALNGLGKGNIFQSIKKAANNVSNAVKKDVQKAGQAIKKTETAVSKDVQTAAKDAGKFVQTAEKDVAKAAKDVYHFIGKYDPINVLIRTGLLAAIKANFLNVAKNLRVALYSDADLKAKNANMSMAQKARTAYNNFKNSWINVFGGTESDLQNAIKAGSGMNGLGDPAASPTDADIANGINTITAASGHPEHKTNFLQIIGPILKKLLMDFTGIDIDAIFPPSVPGTVAPQNYNAPGLPPTVMPDSSQDTGVNFNPDAAAQAVEQVAADVAQLTDKGAQTAPYNRTVQELKKRGKLPKTKAALPGKKVKRPVSVKPGKSGGNSSSGLAIAAAGAIALLALSGNHQKTART